MKTKFIYTFFFILFSVVQLIAQSKIVKANIKVYGNCTMCKHRIETALDLTGVKLAQWDSKTKNLAIVYNPSKISEQKICEAVAAAGHDTDTIKARDEVYAKLPFCCLYRDAAGDDVKMEHHQ